MKSILVLSTTTALLISTKSGFGQGSLTPPDAPAPTMKTLEQIEPRTPISSLPFVITNSGSYFVTGNLTGVAGQHGITIDINNVTLDLSGFSLTGGPGSSNGIYISPGTTNIVIRNGILQRWGGDGIGTKLEDSPMNEACCVESIRASHNAGSGIRFHGAGFIKGSIVKSCQTLSNGKAGISAEAVHDSAAHENTESGILGNQIKNCVASGSYNGIEVLGGTLVGCTSTENDNGIWIGEGAVIRDCYLANNGTGIFHNFYSTEGSLIMGCTLRNNTNAAIWLFHNANVQDCNILVNHPESVGIKVYTQAVIQNNRVRGQGGGTVGISARSESRIEGNHVSRCGIGISASEEGNIIFKNTAGYCLTNFNVASNNIVGTILTTATDANSPTNGCNINISLNIE